MAFVLGLLPLIALFFQKSRNFLLYFFEGIITGSQFLTLLAIWVSFWVIVELFLLFAVRRLKDSNPQANHNRECAK